MTLLPGFYNNDVEADLRLTWSLFEEVTVLYKNESERKRLLSVVCCDCYLVIVEARDPDERPLMQYNSSVEGKV